MRDEGWSAHPSASAIGCYIDGTLALEERSDIEAHLSRCQDCRRVARDSIGTLARRRRRRYAVAGIAVTTAVAASVAALAIFPAWETANGPPRTRDSSEASTTVIPVVAPQGGVAAGPPVVFVWRSMGSGVRYRLSLSTPEGEELWGASLPDTVAILPDDVELSAGRTYVWYVDALLAEGGSATTGVQRLIVRQ